MHIDTILYANEMNKAHYTDKKLQYDFFINSLKPRKRFSSWVKNSIKEDIEIVRQYYGYNYEKASKALQILTNNELTQIKKMLNKGG
jgi:predicted transcriptional regulator